jgi:hypothetical protein
MGISPARMFGQSLFVVVVLGTAVWAARRAWTAPRQSPRSPIA